MLKDPEIAKEVQMMMKDPEFQRQMKVNLFHFINDHDQYQQYHNRPILTLLLSRKLLNMPLMKLTG